MPLQFPCPCGRLLQVESVMAGKRVRCPACRLIVWVPPADVPTASLAEPVTVVDPPPSPRPALAPPESRPQPAPPTAPDRVPASAPLCRAANAVAIAGFLVFGLALAWVGCRQESSAGRPFLIGIAALFFVMAGSSVGTRRPAAPAEPVQARPAAPATPPQVSGNTVTCPSPAPSRSFRLDTACPGVAGALGFLGWLLCLVPLFLKFPNPAPWFLLGLACAGVASVANAADRRRGLGSAVLSFLLMAGFSAIVCSTVTGKLPGRLRRPSSVPVAASPQLRSDCAGRLEAAARAVDDWQRAHRGVMPASVGDVPGPAGQFTCPRGAAYLYERDGDSATLRCPLHDRAWWNITPDEPR